MKRIFIMLLIACSAISTISADSTANPQKKAKSVIQDLEGVIAFYAEEGNQTLSIIKNPETGLIESSERIVPFTCGKEDLWNIPIGFNHDEPLSYQYFHLLPGNTELFNLKVVTNNGQKSKDVRIRTNSKQEMWFMCCKNPDNPQLRDAYAIVWEETKDNKVAGTVFMITSLRPDYYEQSMSGGTGIFNNNSQSTTAKTFKIVGRVDENIKDSLYNIYIADTGEELANIGDDDYIACVPVINKRFEWQTELDHRCVGRLRCIFPDGSLCSAWINLDFVPGETYNITVHNGWYDEDRDFERRVGRNSGKSLLTARQSAGNDDVLTVDTVPVYDDDNIVLDGVEIAEPENQWGAQAVPVTRGQEPDNVEAWLKTITPQQQAVMMFKGKSIEEGIERVKEACRPLGEMIKDDMSSAIANIIIPDQIFENILNQNKELDKNVKEFQKAFFALNPPAKLQQDFYSHAYKEILNTFTEQNKGFTWIYAKTGKLSKAAQKTQKYINKLTEKYMNEMMKGIGQMK